MVVDGTEVKNMELRWAGDIPDDQLPPILRRNHNDWPAPFQWVPRKWTAWLGDPPVKVAGTEDEVKPIPDAGKWILEAPFYLAGQSQDGLYARTGLRWDDVDHYYNLSLFTAKVYTVNEAQGGGSAAPDTGGGDADAGFGKQLI